MGKVDFMSSCEISRESSGESLWLEPPSNPPRAGLVADGGEMGTCGSAAGKRSLLSNVVLL